MERLVEATEAVVFSESMQDKKSIHAAWSFSVQLTDKKDQTLAIQQAKQAEARKAARQRHLRAYMKRSDPQDTRGALLAPADT